MTRRDSFAHVLRNGSPLALDLERRALLATRADLWSTVTGSELVDPSDPHCAIRLHGITPADINRVAAINSKLAAVNRRIAAS